MDDGGGTGQTGGQPFPGQTTTPGAPGGTTTTPGGTTTPTPGGTSTPGGQTPGGGSGTPTPDGMTPPSGGTGGSMATPIAGSGSMEDPDPGTDPMDPPATGTELKPRCVTAGTQVVLIGDSYINWASHTLPADLARESGQTWRNYAVGGASMGSGGIALIPPQWDTAKAAGADIRAVVMDGGGNDVLIPAATWIGGADCKNSANSPNIAVCQMIFQTALTAATNLMQKMANDGVRDIVYFFYPHVPNGTILGGTNPNAILDYSLPRAKAACDDAWETSNHKARCHFVDMIPVFEGHMDWFAPTDIHPNAMGSAAMAKAIWARMKEKCIAQPASSGCCEP
jgi:hypothetical protein